MKISNYIIPYPILGLENSFGEKYKVDSVFSFESDTETYRFNVELKLDELNILKLINDDYAKYACEIDCPKTYFRKIFSAKENKFTIEIRKDALAGDVNFFFSVVAVKEISSYKNPAFNQKYYEGYSFNLKPGHLLAFFDQTIFNADIKYSELKALGSIVEVIEDNKEKYTHYEFSTNVIRIFLPSEDFKKFNRTNNHQFADITHASIVQCGLVSALYAYKENKNTTWAQTLALRTKMEDKLKPFADLESLDSGQISQLVSLILDNPNKRMLEKLTTIQAEN